MQIQIRYAVKSLKTGKFFLRMENAKPRFCKSPIPLSKGYASKIVKDLNERVGKTQFEIISVEAFLHPEFGWKSISEG